ncbi:RagB/SusD family nutrient uptake outer membrane protein [Dyadobacter sp. LHD-138]|uniref:RagB/SusD family nutrient uptake outer membrane protein n=1 Tax=Dyadobacter sp. LHD-138 TaxID=3071413 RepID=UPI0027E17ED2|nr:RagB/SusD family nutrient uptake outer membrane protein [Dyadobacter sp. LHD-138]MDQ6480601.1 RagB/SusD family nutrient uptake outer membrane protein [Dyadobacter sp. LHD-138]
MRNYKTISFIFAATFFFYGCNSDLLKTIPNDRVSSEIFWKTENDAVLASNAVYTYLESAANFTNWDAMSDIGHVTLGWREESVIEKGSYDATYGKILNEWNDAYKGIQAANAFLANVDKISVADKVKMDRLKGEVRTLRAYFYTKLAMLYGDVPLVITNMTVEESRMLTRTPVAQVWDFISKEYTESAALLPTSQTDKGRVTKGTALALNARALLYAGRFKEAAVAAKQVMDLNVYNLYPSYENLFSYAAENNVEVIFDKQSIKDIQSNNIFSLTTPNSVFPQVNSFVPTKLAVDAFQTTTGKDIADPASGFDPKNPYVNRDPRLRFSIYVLGSELPNGKIYNSRPDSGTGDAIGNSENSTSTGFNTRKYLNKEDLLQPNNGGINIILMRYAEILLIYAEAKIEANELDQSVLDAINKIRNRPDVKMPPVAVLGSQEELRKIVRNERLVELAFEGLRYFDIRRWKIAETVVPGVLYGMTYTDAKGELKTISIEAFVKVFNKNRDYLWPIPQRERELNPNLTQNPNW